MENDIELMADDLGLIAMFMGAYCYIIKQGMCIYSGTPERVLHHLYYVIRTM